MAHRRSDATRRVRDLLRAELVAGTFPDGRLPSEDELREEFGASRAAVRDALALLRVEGLIDRLQGVGTLATGARVVMSLGEAQGTDLPTPGGIWDGAMHARVVDWQDVPISPVAARSMGAGLDERVLRVDYVAMTGGMALGGATNYMRYPEADALRPEMLQVDWYSMLAGAGLDVGEVSFLIEASIADDHDAAIFGTEVGAAMFVVEQVMHDPDGRAFDFAFARTCADRLMTLSRARRNPAQGQHFSA